MLRLEQFTVQSSSTDNRRSELSKSDVRNSADPGRSGQIRACLRRSAVGTCGGVQLTFGSGRGSRWGGTRIAIGLAATAAIALASAPAGSASAQSVTSHATTPVAATPKPAVEYSDGTPRNARLTIPEVRIHRLPVLAYRGKTDDAPGTRIQNRGIAASPYGPHGGTGPGGLGNYQVTAHRTSHGGVFRHTPTMKNGTLLFVDAGQWRYVYKVIKTRWVSFRSAKDLREQRAPVPGKPGKKPTRGYITVSTCATPEDRAAGNFWTDRFGNPEHRIDKIGVLVKRVERPHLRGGQG